MQQVQASSIGQQDDSKEAILQRLDQWWGVLDEKEKAQEQDQQVEATEPKPAPDDREGWKKYWEKKGWAWRTEPEISEERQETLKRLRLESLDSSTHKHPFFDKKLSRADLEWLFATREKEQSDFRERTRDIPSNNELIIELETIHRLDLRGAYIEYVDLRGLPLDGLKCEGTSFYGSNFCKTDISESQLINSDFELANLSEINFFSVDFGGSSFINSDLSGSSFAWVDIGGADFYGADLSGAQMNSISIDTDEYAPPLFHRAILTDANLTGVEWSKLRYVGEEEDAIEECKNTNIDINKRLGHYEKCHITYNQLFIALQQQGIVEDAARFAYRAKICKRKELYYQMLTEKSFWQRIKTFFLWLWSWIFWLIVGYGYRPLNIFLWYAGIISIFWLSYLFLEPTSFTWITALGESMNVFHGRGVAPNIAGLSYPGWFYGLTIVEGFLGLIIEAMFIATLFQKLFGK